MISLSLNGRFYAARPTGVQRVARELVRRLVVRADVVLHLPAGCPEPPSYVVERCRRVRGRLAGVPWEQAELPLRRRREPELLPLDPANSGPVTGRRGVLLLHDVLPLTHPELYAPGFRRWFALGPARAARRALRVATFSRWAREQMIECLGLEPGRVRVVPQGVEPFDRPLAAARVEPVLARLRVAGPFVLAFGGGDPRKDRGFAERMVACWPGGAAAAPPIVLVGSAHPRIQARAADPGAAGDPGGRRGGPPGSRGASAPAAQARAAPVRRLGHVSDEDLHALLTAASVVCFPSRAEGFGRPPLEAMACGTPVVVGDYACAGEILGDAATILPLEPEAWGPAVASLLEDGPERRARVERGLAGAGSFRWDTAVESLLDVCRDAAGEAGLVQPVPLTGGAA